MTKTKINYDIVFRFFHAKRLVLFPINNSIVKVKKTTLFRFQVRKTNARKKSSNHLFYYQNK